MKGSDHPRVKYRHDYQPPHYLVEQVELHIDLFDSHAEVSASLLMQRHPSAPADSPLVLDGEQLELLAIALDGEPLSPPQYLHGAESLTVLQVPARFTLQTRVRIYPQKNTALSGLYTSGGNFCTQCEAEGFRRISFFPDRPDVMARFRTTLSADKARYPFLLGNGNPVARLALADGRHSVTWDDPYPKPCYLFALVAGDLDLLTDEFITATGRKVALQIYVDKGQLDKCQHGMSSLKKAMAWDEQRFGLEYDLDIYMIVAVSDFNMGAMENKGLNIFNTKYVLAKPETATDSDFDGVESVIGHEYFHNWTGNRVTCRDWFQLSLKEGLTVYRDQEFSADLQSRAVKRIDDVKVIRSAQFSEDAGPMAHPIRPDSYIEMNNFYTVTVYNKGAEIIRMIETLIGRAAFRRGMDLYFARHDGQAVTCEDFVLAMEAASEQDLSQFRRWYEQAGTPELTVTEQFEEGCYRLTFAQHCPPTPGQALKKPFHIPVKLALLGGDGRELVAEQVFSVTEACQSLEFKGLSEKPVPSLLRDFSAPVKLHYPQDDSTLAFLAAHDGNAFNRWDAAQQFALNVMARLIDDHQAGKPLQAPAALIDSLARTLADGRLDPALIARAIGLPEEGYIAEVQEQVDVTAIHAVREFLKRAIATALKPTLLGLYQSCSRATPYRFEGKEVGRRALRNACLGYLMSLNEPAMVSLCQAQYREADNMTDRFAAFRELVYSGEAAGSAVIDDFYHRFEGDALVLDKWFAVQASAPLPGTLARVKTLLTHRAFVFSNPNKVRALIGAFAQNNPLNFHATDGSGYAFLGEQLAHLDAVNPQIAARLCSAFNRWRKYPAAQQAQMRTELEKLAALPAVSRDLFEIVSKALG